MTEKELIKEYADKLRKTIVLLGYKNAITYVIFQEITKDEKDDDGIITIVGSIG